jgi:hypothetical protein
MRRTLRAPHDESNPERRLRRHHMHEPAPVLIQQSDTVQHDVYAAHA